MSDGEKKDNFADDFAVSLPPLCESSAVPFTPLHT
jgi:hypothetical protein